MIAKLLDHPLAGLAAVAIGVIILKTSIWILERRSLSKRSEKIMLYIAFGVFGLVVVFIYGRVFFSVFANAFT